MSDEQKIKCPICDSGKIRVLHSPALKRKSLSRSRAGGSVTLYSEESFEALEGCQKCGKSRDEIEKVLRGHEETKHPSREAILKRLRESGLPLKVTKEIEDK